MTKLRAYLHATSEKSHILKHKASEHVIVSVLLERELKLKAAYQSLICSVQPETLYSYENLFGGKEHDNTNSITKTLIAPKNTSTLRVFIL